MNKKLQKITVILTGIVLISIVLFISGIIPEPHFTTKPTQFTTPSSIQWGTFTQLSNTNYGTHINIYYISWYGCPFGAADSWAFHLYLKNIGYKQHYSNAKDIYPNTPGLLFTDGFSNNTLTFTPIYLYNQTMTGNTLNQTITGSLLTYGLNTLSQKLPQSIYTLEKEVMTIIPTSPFNQPSGIKMQHINTNIIITGPNGAWVLNGAFYNPDLLKGLSTNTVLNGNYSFINNGELEISNIIKGE
jgi:hypothetical protein